MLSRLVPTYGNWGGPGWSGGRYPRGWADTDWEIIAVDSLDYLFKAHDRRYQGAIRKCSLGWISEGEKVRQWREADAQLVRDLKQLPSRPSAWACLPYMHSVLYAWLYRKAAIAVFTVVLAAYARTLP